MNSRMDKYYKEKDSENSRIEKNKHKYASINEEDLANLDLTTNISVLDINGNDVDVEKVKKLLDEKYTKKPLDKYESNIESVDIDKEDTKEYDLEKIISAAHNSQKSDYEKDRFKKISSSQYEILNSLDLNRKEEPTPEEPMSVDEANLMNLIKTVNENSLKRVEKEGLALIEDLQGNEDTEVLKPIESDLMNTYDGKKPSLEEELDKTIKLSKGIIDEEKRIAKEETVEDNNEPEENTFYTGAMKIKNKDYEDFDDLQKEMKSGNTGIKIVIFIIILIILAAGLYFANKYLNLGLF